MEENTQLNAPVEEYKGEMGTFEITGEVYAYNQDGTRHDEPIEVGKVLEVPLEVGMSWVESNVAKRLGHIEPASDTQVSGNAPLIEEKPENSVDETKSDEVVANRLTVIDSNRHKVREYSLEVHGEDFVIMATNFANKINGFVIKSE